MNQRYRCGVFVYSKNFYPFSQSPKHKTDSPFADSIDMEAFLFFFVWQLRIKMTGKDRYLISFVQQTGNNGFKYRFRSAAMRGKIVQNKEDMFVHVLSRLKDIMLNIVIFWLFNSTRTLSVFIDIFVNRLDIFYLFATMKRFFKITSILSSAI